MNIAWCALSLFFYAGRCEKQKTFPALSDNATVILHPCRVLILRPFEFVVEQEKRAA
mgnify:CR=1 FL=1